MLMRPEKVREIDEIQDGVQEKPRDGFSSVILHIASHGNVDDATLRA